MAKRKARVIKGKSNQYLSPGEIDFVKYYLEKGMQNVYEAYIRAYPDTSESTAKKTAYRILKRKVVQDELKAQIKASGITEARIKMNAQKYVDKGLKDVEYSLAGVKSNEMLAKHSGMLDDTVNHRFGEHNPAIFVSPTTEEEKEKFKKMNRIEE
jgi:hypothetical protein